MRPRWKVLVFVLLSAIYVGVRLWRLAEYPLDGDEIFSFVTARSGWDLFLHELIRDAIHPPLFYLLLRGWIGLGGESLFWVRLLPALISCACLVPFFLLAREWKLHWGATVSALMLLALNPYAIYYAQHVRMYSLLTLLSLAALWLLARLLERREEPACLWVLFAVNLFMVYTHYQGWVVVGMEGAAVLLWRRDVFVRFSAQTALAGALFAPWAYVAVRSLAAKGGLGQNLDWVPHPTWLDLSWFYVQLCGLLFVPYASNVALCVLACLAVALAVGLGRRGWLLAGFAFLPAVIAFTASQFTAQSIWGERHLMVSAAPFYLLCGLAARRAPNRHARVGLALFLGAWSVYAFVSDYHHGGMKLRWDTLVAEMLARDPYGGARAPLYVLDSYVGYPLAFHLEATGAWPRFDLHDMSSVDQVAGQGWAAYSRDLWTRGPGPREALQQRGCHTGEEIVIQDRFRRVTVFPVSCAL